MYELYSGKVLKATSDIDLLEKIKNSNMFTEEESLEEYLIDLRKRIAKVEGKMILKDDYKGFIEALIGEGVIRVLA